jgi:hypothetical protein
VFKNNERVLPVDQAPGGASSSTVLLWISAFLDWAMIPPYNLLILEDHGKDFLQCEDEVG